MSFEFPVREMAIEFANRWTRLSLRGHTVSKSTVTLDGLTEKDRGIIEHILGLKSPDWPGNNISRNAHGGKRQNAGRKPGPNGPATARLNIKCTPVELAAWTRAAKAEKLSRSAWVRRKLNT